VIGKPDLSVWLGNRSHSEAAPLGLTIFVSISSGVPFLDLPGAWLVAIEPCILESLPICMIDLGVWDPPAPRHANIVHIS